MSTINSSNTDGAYIRSQQETEDAYREKITNLKEDHAAERKAMMDRRDEERQKLQKDLSKELLAGQDELAAQVANEKQKARDEVSKLQQKMYDKQGAKFAKDSRDLSSERELLSKFRTDVIKDFEHQEAQKTRGNYDIAQKMRKDFNTEAQNALQAQKRSLDGEINTQNKELAYHRAYENRRDKEISHARAKATKDVEHESLWQRRQLQENFESEANRLNDRLKQAGTYHDRRIQEVQAEDNQRMNDTVLKQRKEFAGREVELNRENSRIISEFDRNLASEKTRNTRQQEVMFSMGENDKSKALLEQKANLTKDLAAKDAFYKSEIDEKNQRLLRLQSPKTARDVPQTARDAIEQGVRTDYEAKLNVVNEKRNLERESILRKQMEERVKMQQDNEKVVRTVRRDATIGTDEEKNRMVGAYMDLQAAKDEEKRRFDYSHSKQLEQLTENHSKELEKQTDVIKESVDNFRFQQETKTRHALEDAELKMREKTREFSMQLNTLRREMDKRLTDQKDSYEAQLANLKAERDGIVRETERKGRAANEEAIRGYEHRIAQMELSQKERERYLTEHFEDEIDRMKRTNARLIQKKS